MTHRLPPLALPALLLAAQAAGAAALHVANPRAEYQTDPLGIDAARPRLSWTLSSEVRGQRQTAYQILVAASPAILAQDRGDLWDSGKVRSDETAHIRYGGRPLRARERACWKVRAWDANDAPSPWSAPASWEMGLLERADWHAQWIGLPIEVPPDPLSLDGCHWVWFAPPASAADAAVDPRSGERFFRGRIGIDAGRPVRAARFLLDADDEFTLYVNGRKASSDDITTKSWQQLTEVDVRRLLRPGPNTLAIRAANAGDNAGLVGRLLVEFEDGGTAGIDVDESWKAAAAPAPGWETPGLDDGAWANAAAVAAFGAPPWGRIEPNRAPMQPCPLLRKSFALEAPVRAARASATALGLYDLRINGQRVGDAQLAPGWTDYDQRIEVQTYDVTSMLVPGENVAGAILGDGWYLGTLAHVGRYHYGTYPLRLLFQLDIEYADGRTERVVSDGSWHGSTGPILYSDPQAGELYDARLEQPGWDRPGFAAAAVWRPVDALTLDAAPARGQLVAQVGPPIRITQLVAPVALLQPAAGVTVFDLGQNIVGWCRLRVRGPAGTRITLRHAEMLEADGNIYTENLRGVAATEQYVLRGEGQEEVYEPRFTFHGFRFVEVTGYPGVPHRDAVTGCVVGSDIAHAGTFACSDPLLDRIQSNIAWGQRGNFLSIPTDCPQRNERMGWTGDAQIFAPTACFNRDVAAFYTKWMRDVSGAQLPGGAFPDVAPLVHGMGGGNNAWGDAGVIVPWTVYLWYGDTAIIEENFPAMERWIEYLTRESADLVRPESGYGDWLSVNAQTPRRVVNTAYFARSADLVARMARAIGRDAEADRYALLFDRIRAAFQKAFVAADGAIEGDTQAAYVLALAFDLLTLPQREAAAARLVERIREREWHLSTGFVGTGSLMPVLTRIGRPDVAYRLAINTTYPSWGYSILQGATTMWERWNSFSRAEGYGDASMNSFNHYAFGAVGNWLYGTVAGIEPDPDAPGFRRVRVAPRPGAGLSEARATYHSIRGPISTYWRRDAETFTLELRIPVGATAHVRVPATSPQGVTESGRPAAEAEGVRWLGAEPGASLYEVGSGTYSFTSRGAI